MLPKLNLPEYAFKFKQEKAAIQIFDNIRKKYVVLTPEEWVRQNFINFLIAEKNFPSALFKIESGMKLNKLQKRTDAVIYKNTKPVAILECKAPGVAITQETFNQVSRYNLTCKAKYLIVTNGLQHFCCEINLKEKSYNFLKEVPAYETI